MVVFVPPDIDHPRELPAWPHVPGAEGVEYTVPAGVPLPAGEALWQVIDAGVRGREIDVRVGAAAERLLLDETGAVTGAVVRTDGSPLEIRARGGVVLACGSFEWDAAMREAYLPVGSLVPLGHSGNRGDGLRMAQRAGAAMWHMSAFFGWFVFRTPEFDAGFPLDFHAKPFLWVDADGRARALRGGCVREHLGFLTQFGGGLTDAIVFGRIAGREAAARQA